VSCVRAVGVLAALLIVPACGPGGHSRGGQGVSLSSDEPDRTTPGIDLSGGSGSGPGSTGGDGGGFTVRSLGALQGTRDPAPAPPALPPMPSSGNLITDLSADRVLSGTSIVAAVVTSTPGAATRSVTVNDGDLVVSGTIQAADQQGLSLSASGTIFIAGEVRTSGSAVTLRADRVVVTGTLVTDGVPGSGRPGGAISITSTSDAILMVGGSLSAAGGSGTARGGAGGAVSLRSGGETRLHGAIATGGGMPDGTGNDVHGGSGGPISMAGAGLIVLDSALRFRGASARTTGAGAVGGEGGTFSIESEVPVRLFGIVDGRGGSASASSAGAGLRAGRGGRVSIGASTQVASLALQEAAVASSGGSGDASGGRGGPLDFLATWGGIALGGAFTAEGGGSALAPGAGGIFTATCDFVGGDLTLGATLLLTGGSASPGASSAPGGAGGRANLFAYFDSGSSPSGTGGSIRLGVANLITAHGGDSAGSATAGKGGTVHLEVPQGDVSIAGTISARGGNARGNGRGGLGGLIWTDSDSNANALGGNITVEPGAVLDASGGDSASGTGGDAQWSTTPGIFQAERIPIAVLLDADSVFGGPNPGGVILNKGVIFALGGKPNGHGGDVEFHGASTTTREPEMGDVRNFGDGTGGNGVFVSD